MNKDNEIIGRFVRIVLCGLISLFCMGPICYSEKAVDCNLNNLLENSSVDQGQAVEITLVSGDRMFYEFPLHGSVGVSCRYIIEDNTIVRLTEKKEVYKHPERSDIPGGDAAIGTFYFEAVQPGRTLVTLQHMFRGSIEKEKCINVIVSDEVPNYLAP